MPLQNREIRFYKGLKKEEEDIKYLSIKKENVVWNDFP